jgi:hypothetical protein
MILVVILLSLISAILYRLGGSSAIDQDKEFPWIPRWFKVIPKKRDAGCGACVVATGLALGITAPWWAWFLAWGLMWGALSTYWDPIFDYDNHYAHGFGIGLAMGPVMFFDEPLALGIRIAVLAVAMGIWSKINGNATKEELGRGFLMPITLVLVWI